MLITNTVQGPTRLAVADRTSATMVTKGITCPRRASELLISRKMANLVMARLKVFKTLPSFEFSMTVFLLMNFNVRMGSTIDIANVGIVITDGITRL